MILVFVEHDGARPDPASLEALTLARGLAGELGVPLTALLAGAGEREAAVQLAAYGVETAHLAGDDRLGGDAPAAWGRCLADLVAAAAPRVVVAAGTARGHEVLAHAAALAGAPMAANCTEVRAAAGGQPDAFEVTRLRWGGSVLEDARLEGATVFLSVAEHVVASLPAPPAGMGTAPAGLRVESLPGAIDPADLRVRLVERGVAAEGRISLADARVVVGGGRGVGGPEGFAALEELARLLGGTVGVSRVATSAGWRPHAEQVGQTGTRIAPDLYIACGISGAIQHIVGCRAAKAILAINTDRDAPIMSRATYAVIGDLHAVVPAITAELRRALGE